MENDDDDGGGHAVGISVGGWERGQKNDDDQVKDDDPSRLFSPFSACFAWTTLWPTVAAAGAGQTLEKGPRLAFGRRRGVNKFIIRQECAREGQRSA